MDNIKLKKKPIVINLGDEKASYKAFWRHVATNMLESWKRETKKSKEKTNTGVIVIPNDMNEDKKKKTKLFEEAWEQDE